MHATGNFATKVWKGELSPDLIKDTPLDMFQYQNLFGTRIPHPHRDDLIFSPPKTRHITVLYRDCYYTVNIFDEKGAPLSRKSIEKALNTIVNNTKTNGTPIGIFTSEERTKWSEIRDLLSQNKVCSK